MSQRNIRIEMSVISSSFTGNPSLLKSASEIVCRFWARLQPVNVASKLKKFLARIGESEERTHPYVEEEEKEEEDPETYDWNFQGCTSESDEDEDFSCESDSGEEVTSNTSTRTLRKRKFEAKQSKKEQGPKEGPKKRKVTPPMR